MRAGIYARISRDTRDPEEERGLGTDRQVEACQKLAASLGWEVVRVYEENDTSASTLSSKPRPLYAALLNDIRTGVVEAVAAYSNSRLTRRPLEWIEISNLAASSGLRIATVVSGSHDLTTADGRAVALTVAAWDAAEAERTSERLKSQKAQRAARGLPQGGRYRVFGYTRAFELLEDEAQVVRDIFIRKARGESATSIARLLKAQGLLTAAGKPWSQSSVSKLVSRPGYCGLREYRGEIVGKTAYPSIIDEALWRQANSVAAKTSPGTNARRHLLSGFALCGKCSGSMVGGPRGYRCHQAHGGCGNTKIKTAWLDGPVVTLVMSHEGRRKPSSRSSEVTVDFGPIDRDIDAVHAARASGDLDLADAITLLKDLRAKRREGERQMAQQAKDFVMGGSMALWLEWGDLDLSQQRLMIGKHLRSVVVGPRQSSGPGRFEPERLTLNWVDGTVQHLTQADLDSVPYFDPETGALRHNPTKAPATLRLPPTVLSRSSEGASSKSIMN